MAPPVPFGRYMLFDRLAVGGMAELFLAKSMGEAGFQKTCVIKRVLPHLAESPAFVEMFLDEARLAAKLDHPGIVQIFDLGRQGDDYFLAMEYLAGEDASAIISRASMRKMDVPMEICAKIISSAAEALQYAHDLTDDDGRPLHIVHRDISPSNLFVTYQGSVKLLDFGIARAESRAQTTEVGQIKGKASYMSPEQAQGLPVDRRADIWALGVCLHELLTGQRLFGGENRAHTFSLVGRQQILRPSALKPGIPEQLDRVVMKALARNLADRYPTAERMRIDLDLFLADRTYVPQTIQLGDFLKALFGAERAEERIRRATAQVSVSQPGGGTERISEKSSLGQSAPASARTIPSDRPTLAHPSQEAARTTGGRARTRRLVFSTVLLAALIGGGLVLLESQEDSSFPPSQPSSPVELPATHLPAPERATSDVDAGKPESPVPGKRPGLSLGNYELRIPEELAPNPSTSPPGRAATRPRRAALAVGFLSVEANVPAQVLVDDNRLGHTPIVRARLSAGSHRLKVENKELGLVRVERFTVSPGEETLSKVRFGKGNLNVKASPWADVWLDGTKLGQTPLAGKEVWEGPHTLRLVGPSGEKTLRVDIRAGETFVVNERL